MWKRINHEHPKYKLPRIQDCKVGQRNMSMNAKTTSLRWKALKYSGF